MSNEGRLLLLCYVVYYQGATPLLFYMTHLYEKSLLLYLCFNNELNSCTDNPHRKCALLAMTQKWFGLVVFSSPTNGESLGLPRCVC